MSVIFHNICKVFLIFYKRINIFLINMESFYIQITADIKYFYYFKNCIGIIDDILY